MRSLVALVVGACDALLRVGREVPPAAEQNFISISRADCCREIRRRIDYVELAGLEDRVEHRRAPGAAARL